MRRALAGVFILAALSGACGVKRSPSPPPGASLGRGVPHAERAERAESVGASVGEGAARDLAGVGR